MTLEEIVEQTEKQISSLSEDLKMLRALLADYNTIEASGNNGTVIVDQWNRVRQNMIEKLAQAGNNL
jgi:hypothetical protein